METNSKQENQPKWQEKFNSFIEQFIINKKSLFRDFEMDFNNDDLENCLVLLKDVQTMNPSKDKKSLYETLKAAKDNAREDKEQEQYKKNFVLLWHCYWIMYIMGKTAASFFTDLIPEGLVFNTKDLIVEEYASTRQIYNRNAIAPFRCLLRLFKLLWGKDDNRSYEDVKNDIINILLYDKTNNWKDDTYYDGRIKNILIYLCKPDEYVPIISQTHKANIYKNLGFLVNTGNDTESNIEEKPEKEADERKKEEVLKKIESIFIPTGKGEIPQQHKEYGLYANDLRPFWDSSEFNMGVDKEGELAAETLLRYKKAIVLYGPPGTGKSYTAREIAQSIIAKTFAQNLKKQNDQSKKQKQFSSFIENENYLFDGLDEKKGQQDKPIKHIHRLQMHPNYTYDDFIIGKTIEDQNIKPEKGYLLKLIDRINDDRKDANNLFCDLPHIVILDEINRVDLSRLFGELFTAMESDYRKDGVDLPIGDCKLKVPEDMYFIGTMNQIDFSLEQVDFALRRRFTWIECTFDKSKLEEIINDKLNETAFKGDFDIKKYVDLCENVNDVIASEPLGREYWIGHSFFAEIVDIYKETGLNGWNEAKAFLWTISIKPMIEAYCGTMDAVAKKDYIEKCQKAFFPQ